MITKKTLGNVEDVTIVTFGNGTTRVVNGQAIDNSYKGLYLTDQETPKTIGEVGEFAANTDQFKPKIAIHFYNKESFDVFYEFVLNIKNEYEKP